MGYSRRKLIYLEIIELSNPIHMMSMVDPVDVNVDTLTIDSWCSLEKQFTELIHMNPSMVIIPTCQSR